MSPCPLATAYPADPTRPSPETLAYSLTLPAALASPALARAATRAFLAAHDLRDIMDAALQAIGELAAAACQFTESPDFYLSLRYRGDAFRVIVYDRHPRHTHPRLAAACDGRRRAALRVLACVCRACDGDWGFGESREPGGGTRMWATLPRASAAEYGSEAPFISLRSVP
ncbi:ATP-binding protein [Streptomyces sp. NBC_01728]|uniref:ATP-binding protein n=1 Tax=unclassified Streptomyces TaxID=2593676 RepID=UPI0022508185|nr:MULTISPECIES: ATP-binding protein [unclassified Streptomyces]MCX4456500.1 ATP-binding protein [Streptomyces sp. NBC_01719]MCX4495858.1 ATP-binding protein [Streptomyces sp. NBC_01728]